MKNIIITVLVILVLGLSGYLVYDKVIVGNNNSVTQNKQDEVNKEEQNADEIVKEENLRTFKCFKESGGQFGFETELSTFVFENEKLKTINIEGVLFFDGVEVTGNEYKENKYLLNNFCALKECVSIQKNYTLYREINIDFDNSEDLNNFSQYKDININQVLNSGIVGNDLDNTNANCYEVK